MARLSQKGFPVPDWFCVSAKAFAAFVEQNRLEIDPPAGAGADFSAFAAEIERTFLAARFPKDVKVEVLKQLAHADLEDCFVAVRSSGLDEDSPDHSFAGQFSSFLFQKGKGAILESIVRCWASGFSERALSYRVERGLSLKNIGVGVVIQRMIDAECSGVAFSRNPIRPLDRESLIVDSVWGLGEGLVSGALDADHFEVNRKNLRFESTIVPKEQAFRQAPDGGVVPVDVPKEEQEVPSLTEERVAEVARLAIGLEEQMGSPQDCEWAYRGGTLYCLQTRPITTLPREEFYSKDIKGNEAILWDNSNIIESYSGVTSPLTFSFASYAYNQVYIQFCETMGVPEDMISAHESMFRNMLGLIRGRIYYNLINWYRLVLLLPGASTNKAFMETMMGVKQGLKPEFASLFDFMKNPPRYSLRKRIAALFVTIYRFIKMDTIIETFQSHFEGIYSESRRMNFRGTSLPKLSAHYQYLAEEVLRNWKAPIINDYLCMIFFGLLKKLTAKWVAAGDEGASLQNDLLCGEGDLKSTEPTKMLMRMAAKIDTGDGPFREWFTSTRSEEVWDALLTEGKSPEILADIREFLDRFGFRCVNELKLEEPDLHDDPSFIINAVAGYVRTKSYSIETMEEREAAIRSKAEELARGKLGLVKRRLYFWVLKQARRAVKNRENLRFDRTKIFGVCRHLFRAMGAHFQELGLLDDERDIFYLTVQEILAFVEGRPITTNLRSIVEERRREFDQYRKTPPPPDRFMTYGAAGASFEYPEVLSDADLLRSEALASTDPNVLVGTPCCPGVVEGEVRVAHTLKDAEGLNGEILVTSRTDPGWVPLYPSCSGLVIERGSLLSHSAVVARELGLPTIVGVSGGLMEKLKSGQRVRVDAGKGELRILQ
jgi:pyruvate,water dikinase